MQGQIICSCLSEIYRAIIVKRFHRTDMYILKDFRSFVSYICDQDICLVSSYNAAEHITAREEILISFKWFEDIVLIERQLYASNSYPYKRLSGNFSHLDIPHLVFCDFLLRGNVEIADELLA